jgi:hypothetical protein
MTTTLQHANLAQQRWTTLQKIVFRFFFVYFVLYCFPFPLNMIQWIDPLIRPFYHFQDWWVTLVGQIVFNLPVKNYHYIFQRTGDTGYGFSFMFTIGLAALLLTVIWSVADSKRLNYKKLNLWLRLYIRFFLAFTLFSYGFIKVFPSQFPDTTASTLVQTFGDVTPLRLAWNFMGYSESFMRFTGLAEVLAGLLLLFRRTTTLGALLAISVLSVVLMMNFGFSMGGKLYLLHLVAIAIFLFVGDAKRLVHFFILNKPIEAIPEMPLIRHPVGRKILLVTQIGLGIWMLYIHIADSRLSERESGIKFPKPLLYGVYKTEYFLRNKDTIPPLQSDSLRWKQLVIDDDGNWKQSSLHFNNDTYTHYTINADTIKKTILIKSLTDEAENYLFNYSLTDSTRVLLTGIWKKDSIEIMMKKYDLNNYRLHRAKFKWIVD